MSLIRAAIDAFHRPQAEARAIVTQAGTLESPSDPSIFGGSMPASSGVSVTERTAQAIPVVFACDKVIKQDVAKTPIVLKQKLKDGTRVDDVNDPLFPILHELPNPVNTAYEFKETMQGFLNLWGNAYAQIDRDARGIVTALWILDPSRMIVDLDGLNRLRYRYRLASGGEKTWIYDPANPPIFHLRQNALDGIHGRGPVQVLRESMGTAIAQDRFEARFYGQGGHPRVALSTTQKLNEASARRIRQDFETLTVGEHNWHRVVVLDHDLKPVPLVMPNKDAQFLELKKLGRDELCGAFRVPPHKIANLERSTNNNIEHQAIEYVGDCLMPHFICWQQAINRDLLNPARFATHFAVFKVDTLIRGDMAAMNTALAAQRQNGVINANEWRRAVDMDDQIATTDGGNDYLVNGTMVPVRRPLAAEPAPAGAVN
jgi:HK97 family phage portal protein